MEVGVISLQARSSRGNVELSRSEKSTDGLAARSERERFNLLSAVTSI
jgi:hypothetical protein